MKIRLLLVCMIFICPLLSFAEDTTSISYPYFRLLKMDSVHYLTQKDLPAHKNTVFINFSPTCEHCQRTIGDILKNIEKFKETQFVLSSFEVFNAIKQFHTDYKLEKYPTIFIGQEQNFELTRKLNYSSFPCSILFDQNNKYILKIEGEAKSKEYLRLLKLK